MKMRVPHQIIESGRRAVMAIWGNMIDARRTMITIPGGYILKGKFKRGVRAKSRRKLQRDTQAGQQMTYPTLKLTMKV
jgi:hypothetical protein